MITKLKNIPLYLFTSYMVTAALFIQLLPVIPFTKSILKSFEPPRCQISLDCTCYADECTCDHTKDLMLVEEHSESDVGDCCSKKDISFGQAITAHNCNSCNSNTRGTPNLKNIENFLVKLIAKESPIEKLIAIIELPSPNIKSLNENDIFHPPKI